MYNICMAKSYYNERNIKNLNKLHDVLNLLPDFCGEFFLGIEHKTSVLTRLNYGYDLKVFFEYISNNILKKHIKEISIDDLGHLSRTDIEKYISFLTLYKGSDGKIHTNKEYSKARRLASLRAFFKYFYNKDKLKENVTAKIDFPKIKSHEILRLEPNEAADLIDITESGEMLSEHQKTYHSKTRLRDAAILTLFLGTGIRISELVGLNIEDIYFDNNAFSVIRKGGNSTILYFSIEVEEALKKYLEQRLQNKNCKTTALFLSLQNKRISVRAVQNLVEKYARIVSPLKKITPHKLRSTFGTELYKSTGDIYIVADILGHSDINTTKKHYAAISDEMRRNVTNKIKIRE